jgi:hypothetical protein
LAEGAALDLCELCLSDVLVGAYVDDEISDLTFVGGVGATVEGGIEGDGEGLGFIDGEKSKSERETDDGDGFSCESARVWGEGEGGWDAACGKCG